MVGMKDTRIGTQEPYEDRHVDSGKVKGIQLREIVMFPLFS